MKMKGVYEANPSMGDPMSIEGQLNECSHRLEKLQQELNKFQLYLEEASGEGARTANGSPSAPNRKHKGAGLLNGIHSRNHRFVSEYSICGGLFDGAV